MVQDMRDTGRITRLMEREDLYMLMETSMKETGKMIKLMVMESILIQMAQDMKVNGGKINNMAMVLKNGQMEHAIKGITLKERNTAKESSYGQIIALLLGSLLIIILKVQVFMSGQMEESTMVNGKTIKCRATVHSHGQMEEGMLESISMT